MCKAKRRKCCAPVCLWPRGWLLCSSPENTARLTSVVGCCRWLDVFGAALFGKFIPVSLRKGSIWSFPRGAIENHPHFFKCDQPPFHHFIQPRQHLLDALG